MFGHWRRIFELALIQYPEGMSDRRSLITAKLLGKTLYQVLHHYQVLIYDLELIESGRAEILDYKDNELEDEQEREQVGDNFSEECPPDDHKISSGSSQ